MKRDVDFTDVTPIEIQPDTGSFMDGIITAVCLCVMFWALVLGVASYFYDL